MKMKTTTYRAICFILLSVLALACSRVHAQQTTNGGVVFPQGLRSFADAVVEYSVGNPAPTAPHQSPENALGAPNYAGVNLCSSGANCSFVSLGSGGRITLQFIDNALTGSGTTNHDLWVFEVGPDVEDTLVEISRDGRTWFSVGRVTGSTRGIDIDAYGFGPTDRFSFVRLSDDPNEGGNSGATVGADIDAVGAISSAFPPPSLTISRLSTEQVALCWKSESNVFYQVESMSDLMPHVWLPFGAPISGNGTTNCVIDSLLGSPRRFYQVYMYTVP